MSLLERKNMNLMEALDNVDSQKDFITFIDALLMDFKHNKYRWENNNLEDFLGALRSYSQDIGGYYKNIGKNIDLDKPNWKVFADCLYGATIYE